MTEGPKRGWGQREPAATMRGGRGRHSARAPHVFRVAEVNRAVRESLETKFSDFWVEGEISEAKPSAAGHVYFSLSDENERAQLRCVLFRADRARARARMKDGERVRVRGQLTFFEPRGSTQLVARLVEPVGEGDLAARFLRIRKTLAAEGLLDPKRKRPLPRYPRLVAVVTSASSAAVHDIIRVASKRAPVRLVIIDCRTQGPDAPRSIVAALKAAQDLASLDVVIVGRGGGSAEELWAFNDERVARAIAACRVPVVCGVGHETDITIAELVADVRASTPSNAAELAVPSFGQLGDELRSWQRRLERAFATSIDIQRLRLERLRGRLKEPGTLMGVSRRRLKSGEDRAVQVMRAVLRGERQRLERLRRNVRDHDPRILLARDRQRLHALSTRLERAIQVSVETDRRRNEQLQETLLSLPTPLLERHRGRLAQAVTGLSALSPLRVLERGYGIAFSEGRAIRSADEVRVGETVDIRLHHGALRTVVTETRGTSDEFS